MIFRKAKPKKYASELFSLIGLPSYNTPHSLVWENPMKNITKIVLKDEEVKHTFPTSHWDFVYSTARFPLVKEWHASILVWVSGSILIDQLKKQVTARCGGIGKNQVTLGLVDDLVQGRLNNLVYEKGPMGVKREYARRIKQDIGTRRFPLSF